MAATAHLAGALHESWQTPRPNGPAAVLAIGESRQTACARTSTYPDWYFRVTNSDHLTTLKNKMKRICEKSGIKKRHFHYTDETIAAHPEFLDRAAPSLDARLRITESAVPESAAAAAARAIAEWGRPAADITHLVLDTNSIAHAPGADLRVAALLSLRTLLSFHGCSGGCSALRVAKDLVETSRGARMLVASAELVTSLYIRAPDEASPEALVAAALFGDGAGAAVVGADPEGSTERAVFYMVAASQATLPGTERALSMHLGSCGYDDGEWGVVLGIGPGITIEMMVLRAASSRDQY